MKIREDLGLVYGVGSYNCYYMDGAIYEIYASTEPKNSKQLVSAVDEEIVKMLSDGVSEEELQRAKNIIKSQFYRSMDTSHGTIGQILYEEFLDYTIGSKFLAEIEQVTIEDIHEVAKTIFSGNRYMVIGTGA